MKKLKPIREPIHAALVGLLRELPDSNKCVKFEKEKFMRAFELVINYLYPDKIEDKQ